MATAPMYESFAAVTLLVLGLLILLARASQAMFGDPGEGTGIEGDAENGDDGDGTGESAGVPATGAARIERHPDTGLSRAERIEREVLDAGHDEAGNPWQDGADDESSQEGDEASADDAEPSRDDGDSLRDDADSSRDDAGTPWGENPAEADARRAPGRRGRRRDELDLSTGALLANVAFSQGVFGAALVGAAWVADLPLADLGIAPGDPWNAGLPAVGLGLAVGVALYVADELAAVAVDAAGVEYAEGVRESLAPDSLRGWAILLGVVLPVIAGFEELLFRAALIGTFAAGFGLSPWLLAVLSTAAFAVGHGAQGPGGVVVTGALGFALAAAFVLSGSLLVVVVAHYVVNALEFVIHEGLGIEWT